jgi:hypothetical protein
MEEFGKSAGEVEGIIKGIVAARPTGTQEWMDFLKEMEEAGKAGKMSFVEGLTGFSSRSDDLQKGIDENKANAAQEQLAFEQQKIELLRDQGAISAADAARRIEALKDQAVLQKNLDEQHAIKSEIASKQSDFGEMNRLAEKNPVEAALSKKQEADARVNDLQRQIEDIPKAISGNEKLRKEALDNSKGFHLDPSERGRWLDQAEALGNRNSSLRAQYDKAKSEFSGAVSDQSEAGTGLENSKAYRNHALELGNQIANLNNKLGITEDRQRRQTPLEMEKNHMEAMKAFAKASMPPPAHVTDKTSYEKMGFVMGQQNLMKRSEDLLQQIVRNTTSLAAGGGVPVRDPFCGAINGI